MFRRLFTIIGVACAGTGIVLVASRHSQNQACNMHQFNSARLGASDQCVHIMWSYFGGFGLMVGGLLLLLIGLASMRKMSGNKARRRPKRRTGLEIWEASRRGSKTGA